MNLNFNYCQTNSQHRQTKKDIQTEREREREAGGRERDGGNVSLTLRQPTYEAK